MSNNDKIKIATSIPGLKDKVKIDIPSDTGIIYWYIKFNIPLDEKSVSYRTMEVIDTDGYVMRTDISYDSKLNAIVISPLDTYEQNIYYILSISENVRSARGQNLRSKIHIMFKLIGTAISEFKVLKSNVSIPKSKPRPKDYDKMRTKSKVYVFDKNPYENLPQDKLPSLPVKINLIPPVLGLITIFLNYFIKNNYFLYGSILACLVGALYLIIQLTKSERKSEIYYNLGASEFNKGKYEKASKSLKLALKLNPENEMAEYGVNKISFYVKDE